MGDLPFVHNGEPPAAVVDGGGACGGGGAGQCAGVISGC